MSKKSNKTFKVKAKIGFVTEVDKDRFFYDNPFHERRGKRKYDHNIRILPYELVTLERANGKLSVTCSYKDEEEYCTATLTGQFADTKMPYYDPSVGEYKERVVSFIVENEGKTMEFGLFKRVNVPDDIWEQVCNNTVEFLNGEAVESVVYDTPKRSTRVFQSIKTVV